MTVEVFYGLQSIISGMFSCRGILTFFFIYFHQCKIDEISKGAVLFNIKK